MKYLLPIILLTLIITACNQNVVYRDVQKLDNKSWDEGETLHFEAEIEEAGEYAAIFIVRHHTSFALSEMNISISATTPEGEEIRESTTIDIREDDGGFIAEGAGDYWDLEQAVLGGFSFDQPGKYHFEISHPYNQRIPLLLSLGLKIEKQE